MLAGNFSLQYYKFLQFLRN